MDPKDPQVTRPKALAEIDDLFDELAMLLKNADVGEALGALGVNVSLALTAADGLHAYLRGKKEAAVEDFETVAEEIRARLASGREPGVRGNDEKGKPS